MARLSTSARVWLALGAFVLAVKLLFLAFPPQFTAQGQAFVFSWPMVLGLWGMLALGAWLSPRAQFPEPLDPRVTNWQRFGVPLLLGLAYGAATIVPKLLGDSGRLHPHLIGTETHVPLPLSLPFYAYGALFLEAMLRLFGVSLLTWLGRRRQVAFWLAAVALALYEPGPYLAQDLEGRAGLEVIGVVASHLVTPLFVTNVLAAWLLRRWGFFAPLTMRLSHYAIWHILYGGILT